MTSFPIRESAGEDIESQAGSSFMYPFGGPLTCTMRDTDLAVISLPLERIEQVAAEHTGVATGDVRFESMAPVSPAMNRYVAGVLGLVHHDLAGPEPGMANPLVHQHLLDPAAAAAGVGSRALQYGFRSRYGTSPVGYLHRVRLEHAHRDLQVAEPTNGATVAGIAAAWGFANPGRFATYYRAAYGRPPSHTLRG